ncbi:MAG: alcohol dehydrogenase catalytic domain-containing protein [Phycisphaerae bacterium]|nr:alcohol dehydrogenase catalytic domain-containing protein [Phycisphaerae bacterium]
MRLEPAAPVPAPGAGEALVRPRRMGVGASDLAVAGGRTGFRGVMGHEFVGVVEAVNGPPDAVERFAGKRVVGSAVIVCGRCDMCRAGLSGHCRARTVLGLHGRDGCFAESFTLPVANLVEVPADVDEEQAVFASPLAAALHTRQMFRVEGKPYITVLGDGRMGLLVAQVMAPLNARVRLLGRHAEKLGLCDKWGIRHRLVDEAGRRQDQDVVIDCTGRPDGLATALGMVRPRGKVVLMSAPAPAGGAGAPTGVAGPIDLSPIVTGEIEVVGSRCGSLAEALEALRRGRVDVLSLITRRARLADGPRAIESAGRGQIKVLMEP